MRRATRRIHPRALIGALIGGVACASVPANPDTPEGMLGRAIRAAGGANALGSARALIWTGRATVHFSGRTIEIRGRWAVQPPDTAVIATYEASRGPLATRRLILAAPRGWMQRDTLFAPMPPAMLANEREQFYLYDVMRLVPLRARDVVLARIAPDTAGNVGLRATRSARPAVDLFFDASWMLVHMRAVVTDPTRGVPVTQDLWLSDHIEIDRVRWPKSIRITLDGRPYFDLTIETLRVADRVDDPLLAGPT